MRGAGLCLVLACWATHPLRGQDLDSAAVRVPLDSALRLADRAAASAFPDRSGYQLYSIVPRALKGDPGGLHWQVRWQEKTFPHRRWLLVRVYMNDGHATTERLTH
ncbi:MAG TPA: hypothetical protein VMY76_16820 [Gemmatimonadales bacterium]|nr:hypothetical protein [Gemmatimonadales bacterium]